MKSSLLFITFFLVQLLSAQDFTEVLPSPFSDGVDVGSISFFDADEDSDFDVLITGGTGSEGFAKLFFNNGQGDFNEAIGTPFTAVFISSAAIADVDGDDDLDVLITGSLGAIQPSTKLYLNDGLGMFFEETSNSFNQVSGGSCAFADIDNDGDQDVLLTGLNQTGFQASSNLYLNDGLGNFSEVMETPFEDIAESSIAFSDVDGDDDQDVLITGQNNEYNPVTKLYLNDGMGIYTEMVETAFEDVSQSSIAFSDVDGDDDQDVLITGRIFSGGSISKLYINNGLGEFSEMINTPFIGVQFSSVAFSDVDMDNDQDVLITGSGINLSATSKLYVNDGTGTYSEFVTGLFDDVMFSTVAFSDIDGDNDEDVLIMGRDTISYGVRSTKLYKNNNVTSSIETSLTRNSFDFDIYPNPTTASKINVKLRSSNSRVIVASVFDSEGKKISEVKKDITSDQEIFSIDISNFSNGIYILQLSNGFKVISREFVVQ